MQLNESKTKGNILVGDRHKQVLHYELFTHWQAEQHPLCFSKSKLHSSLMDITTLLYVLYILCLDSINAAQLSVTAPVGSTVVLPCEWRDLSVQTPHVVWTIEHEVVFERKGKDSLQAEGYEGRVDVPEDELLKGNCSLVLKNVRVTDEAEYRSSMLLEHPKKSVLVQEVHLSVYNRTEERIKERTDSSDRTEESPDSSDNGVKNLHYLWILIILPGLVLLGLGVWLLKKKNSAYFQTKNTEESKEMN
ncbi:uncharacterized protein Hap1MRO34_024962 [Clarias gariepinus]|uniref:uncharacterized protein LOC128507245 n=1 Tax=Clarias gariepinus TaxID=13013 RepID=UPI00234D7B62|nr:uncharacterized protein LOC128507245 [Clarias gariepinus]